MKVRKHWLAKHHKQLHHLCSVTNSLSGLIFVKIRAESKQIFSKNPGKTKFCDSVIYLWFRARSDRYFAVWRTCTKSQKSGQNHKHPGDFPQMPGYPSARIYPGDLVTLPMTKRKHCFAKHQKQLHHLSQRGSTGLEAGHSWTPWNGE